MLEDVDKDKVDRQICVIKNLLKNMIKAGILKEEKDQIIYTLS
jgi:hypothetical protein